MDRAPSNVSEDITIVFEKECPIKVTHVGGDSKPDNLTIRMALGSSKQTTLHSNRCTRWLRMQVTNERDLFFLHTMEVNEDDFLNLKAEQSILVDFSTFPSKMVELLELCIESAQEINPRFVAVLSLRHGESTFSIIETNHFKQLCHISLLFRPGNDSAIKQYLASRVLDALAAITELKTRLTSANESIDGLSEENEKQRSELSQLREQNTSLLMETRAEHALQLSRTKEEAMAQLAQATSRLEQARAEAEAKLEERNAGLVASNAKLDEQVRSLTDCKYSLEMKVAELGAKLRGSEADASALRAECQKLRDDNLGLDGKHHEVGKSLHQHLIRLSALEQEVKDKDGLIANLTAQAEAASSHRGALEAALQETRSALMREEERVALSAAEIKKGNQIIEHLQSDVRNAKSKLKLKSSVLSQQEQLLVDRQAALDKASLELMRSRQELEAKCKECDLLKATVQDLKGKLEEAQKLLQTNQQMIQWLNSQVNDAQLGRLGTVLGGPSRYTFKPSLSDVSPSPFTLPTSGSSCSGLHPASAPGTAGLPGAAVGEKAGGSATVGSSIPMTGTAAYRRPQVTYKPPGTGPSSSSNEPSTLKYTRPQVSVDQAGGHSWLQQGSGLAAPPPSLHTVASNG
eukprot:jgi/Mesvir1/20931/Mv08002-RA.1